MKPKISVITICYNAVDLIEKTILSVLHQSYDNIEYIIIDGNSTDGTVDIIQKYANQLAYWISEPDGGIFDAMNKGLDHATGEWVNFMNAGD
jgi:glycosyltransferase involved in cell wall biosynthesis